MFIFQLYHQHSKHTDTIKPEPLPYPSWPSTWKTTYIKSYPRFKKVNLPKPTTISVDLDETLLSRQSSRVFSNSLNLDNLSNLLYYSLGQKPNSEKRMYPSAGARYPLEFYLLIFKKVSSLETGIYHYDVENHALTLIHQRDFSTEYINSLSLDDYLQAVQCAIIFTANFSRVSAKYKERAYRFVLIEAGIVSQNISLCATALKVDSINLGGPIDSVVEDLIDIDGVDETLVYLMGLG